MRKRRPSPPPRLNDAAEAAPATEQVCYGTRAVDWGYVCFWASPCGDLAVIYPTVGLASSPWRQWQADLAEGNRAIVVLGWGFNPVRGGGPDLHVHDFARDQRYEITWSDLAALIGGPVPYWPSALRTAAAFERWTPSSPDRIIAATTPAGLDLNPALRLAARYDPGSPAHTALLHFASTELHNAATAAAEHLERTAERTAADTITFPARPAPAADPGPLDPALERAGWLQVLDAADDEARATIDALMFVDSGNGRLPATTIVTLPDDEDTAADACAQEWIARLKPTAPTARFALFDDARITAYLVDPATEAVVARDAEGTYWAAIPARLPSPAPLKEVVLQPERIWIRCTDNGLYLCPQTAGDGVNWGFSGGGPGRLAEVLTALLDDVNTDFSDPRTSGADASPGMLALTQTKHEVGTVLDRDQLEQARKR